MPTITIQSSTILQTKRCAAALGVALRGGEVLEMISDVGGGKTTFIKGLAEGLGIADTVQSPTFTISRVYVGRDDTELHHYDFYRLAEAGVVAAELSESLGQPNAVVAIEWGDIVHDVLPNNRITLTIKNLSDQSESRQLDFMIPDSFSYLLQVLQDFKENQEQPV